MIAVLLTMTQVNALQALRVPVAGPEGRPRAAELDRVREDARERLVAAAAHEGVEGLVINPADVVLQPCRPGQRLWMAAWLPCRLVTELDGGPNDGRLVQLPALRGCIEYRQLAPSWQRAAAAGYALPKVSFRYFLAGYDPGRGVYVHRYQEEI